MNNFFFVCFFGLVSSDFSMFSWFLMSPGHLHIVVTISVLIRRSLGMNIYIDVGVTSSIAVTMMFVQRLTGCSWYLPLNWVTDRCGHLVAFLNRRLNWDLDSHVIAVLHGSVHTLRLRHRDVDGVALSDWLGIAYGLRNIHIDGVALCYWFGIADLFDDGPSDGGAGGAWDWDAVLLWYADGNGNAVGHVDAVLPGNTFGNGDTDRD